MKNPITLYPAALALALLLIAASSAITQTTSSTGLAGMKVTNISLDKEQHRLSFDIACDSQQPVTAWAIRVEKTYELGPPTTAEIIEDYVIQLAHSVPTRNPKRGVCYPGQSRPYSLLLNMDGPKGLLLGVHVRVVAVVGFDRTFHGLNEYRDEIQAGRSAKRDQLTAWLQDLERVASASDVATDMRRAADRRERRWPNTGKQTLFDNEGRNIELSQARMLKSIISQARATGVNVAHALAQFKRSVADEAEVATRHADLQEAKRRPITEISFE